MGTRLPNQLQSKLNLPRGCCGRSQQARNPGRLSIGIEDVCVVGRHRHSKVRPIENVKELGSELHVKILRNRFDVAVLENRKI